MKYRNYTVDVFLFFFFFNMTWYLHWGGKNPKSTCFKYYLCYEFFGISDRENLKTEIKMYFKCF